MADTTLDLDDEQLRLLMEVLTAATRGDDDEDGEEDEDPDVRDAAAAGQIDPLVARVLAQAEAQRGEPPYVVRLDEDEAERAWLALSEALDDAADSGDLFAAAELQGVMGLFGRY